jgi:nicotinate-nucleotide pyrophosphorylase
MQNAADHSSVQSGNPSDNHTAIISNLGSLVEQVAAMMKLIESAIANEASAGHLDMAANIVVLDDVTPRYVRANAALSMCNAGLGVALHFVRDIRISKQETLEPSGRLFA